MSRFYLEGIETAKRVLKLQGESIDTPDSINLTDYPFQNGASQWAHSVSTVLEPCEEEKFTLFKKTAQVR